MKLAWLNPIHMLLVRLRPGPITGDQRRVLWLVGIALLIESYDVNIYGLATPQIQKSLGIAEADVGRVIAIFRLGVIPALGLAYLADVFGRRTMLLVTAAGATIATVCTAFTQDVTQFVLAQTLARVCSYAEVMLCFVIIAEEFDETTRGWATGVIGALGALGAGTAALVFALVNVLPFGWRALFLLGAVPLAWLLWARRRLPETRRFEQHKLRATYVGPLVGLFKAYPLRLILMIAVTAPFAFATAPAVILIAKYLQSTHHWAPWQVTTLFLAGGTISLVGTILTGAMGDRIGRRAVLSLSLGIATAGLACLYTWATGIWLAFFWVLIIYGELTTSILIGGLTAELFPTSHRSLAAGVRYLCSILAGALGFLVEGELYEYFGNHAEAITVMLIAAPLALLPIWFLPEPARRSLDEIAPEAVP
jgi:putative MFS transporter